MISINDSVIIVILIIIVTIIIFIAIIIIIYIINIIIIFIMCRFFNAPGLRDPIVMWVIFFMGDLCTNSHNSGYVIKICLGWHGFSGARYRGISRQSCMSLHIGTNNIVGGSITRWYCKRNTIRNVWNMRLLIHSQTYAVPKL